MSPAKSAKQRRAAGMALGAKREGKRPRKGGAAQEMMSMSEAELSKMASKKKRGKGKHP